MSSSHATFRKAGEKKLYGRKTAETIENRTKINNSEENEQRYRKKWENVASLTATLLFEGLSLVLSGKTEQNTGRNVNKCEQLNAVSFCWCKSHITFPID